MTSRVWHIVWNEMICSEEESRARQEKSTLMYGTQTLGGAGGWHVKWRYSKNWWSSRNLSRLWDPTDWKLTPSSLTYRPPELCTLVITHINYTRSTASTCQSVMSHRGTKTNKSWVSRWVNNTQRCFWGLEFVFQRLKVIHPEKAVVCKYIQLHWAVHYWLHLINTE